HAAPTRLNKVEDAPVEREHRIPRCLEGVNLLAAVEHADRVDRHRWFVEVDFGSFDHRVEGRQATCNAEKQVGLLRFPLPGLSVGNALIVVLADCRLTAGSGEDE